MLKFFVYEHLYFIMKSTKGKSFLLDSAHQTLMKAPIGAQLDRSLPSFSSRILVNTIDLSITHSW